MFSHSSTPAKNICINDYQNRRHATFYFTLTGQKRNTCCAVLVYIQHHPFYFYLVISKLTKNEEIICTLINPEAFSLYQVKAFHETYLFMLWKMLYWLHENERLDFYWGCCKQVMFLLLLALRLFLWIGGLLINFLTMIFVRYCSL